MIRTPELDNPINFVAAEQIRINKDIYWAHAIEWAQKKTIEVGNFKLYRNFKEEKSDYFEEFFLKEKINKDGTTPYLILYYINNTGETAQLEVINFVISRIKY